MFLLFYAWPLMATMVSLDLITGHPVRTERWLFNILMVFWGLDLWNDPLPRIDGTRSQEAEQFKRLSLTRRIPRRKEFLGAFGDFA